jgi:hypothetical protein
MGMGLENSQETCRAVLLIATAYLVADPTESCTPTKKPTLLSHSGSSYSQGHKADVLNNDIWTRKAQDLCRTIRFDVSRNYASHEKQLIAYYMDRHWMFDEDDCSSASMESSQHTSLRDVLPSPPPAIITVNKLRMCSDCSPFYDQFCNYFMNVKIRIICVGEQVGSN